MVRVLKLSGIAALFAAGALLAGAIVGGGRAAEATTTDATAELADTTTAEATTTEPAVVPATTVVTTIEQTTTRLVPLPTTTTESTEEGTQAWVWVLLAILAAGLVGLIVLLARRGGGGKSVSADGRRRQLDAAVASWTAQGWAIENQTADSAVLRRGEESLLVSVDEAGHVTTRSLA